MSPTLEAGMTAPAFTLPDQNGDQVSLADADGLTTILYFYPQAETPGCTAEACDFRDNLASLTTAGYRVLGVSRDPLDKLARFSSEHSLGFPVLSDSDHHVHDLYGAWGVKSLYGKTVTGVLRSTFVISPDGVIVYAGYNVKAKGHVAMLRKKLKLAA